MRKTNMRKIFSILVIVAMITVMLPISTFATSTEGYSIVNYYSGKALSIDADNVEQTTFQGASWQRWHIVHRGTTSDNVKYYSIENVYSTRALEVAGSSTDNYANIQQADYTGADNQLWFITMCDTTDFGTYYYIKNKNSNKLVSLSFPYLGDDVNVSQYQYLPEPDQKWAILSFDTH